MIERVSDLVAAYVSNNHIAAGDLPMLIATVHAAMSRLTSNGLSSEHTHYSEETVSSAQIRKSIRPDSLLSFIDGKTYKTLKRHLTKHGFTPDSYRERFGLPGEYPMVASTYSEKRSSLAKSLNFGQRVSRKAPETEAKPAPKVRRKGA